jgi:branched-chain amino acid transport system permease protein
MGSMTGAIIAGFLLGLTEVFVVAHFGASYRDAISFAGLFLILLLRPRGLLGQAALREA